MGKWICRILLPISICILILISVYELYITYYIPLSSKLFVVNCKKIQDKCGIYVFTPFKNDHRIYLEDYICHQVSYSKSRNSVVVSANLAKSKDHRNRIFEYNFKTGRINPLIGYGDYTGNYHYDDYYDSIRYVPKRNAISYILNHTVYIFSLTKKKESYVTETEGGYSFSKDGKNILCTQDNYIYRYHLVTHANKRLFCGSNPEYSPNNEFIAYTDSKDRKACKDLKTEKKWVLDYDECNDYKFSPNNKVIAFSKQNDFMSFCGPVYDIKVWDFKKHRVATIVRNIPLNWSFDWKR